MSNAKRCDRCGACYDIFPPEDCNLSSEWWRYDILKDCHPFLYSTMVDISAVLNDEGYAVIFEAD